LKIKYRSEVKGPFELDNFRFDFIDPKVNKVKTGIISEYKYQPDLRTDLKGSQFPEISNESTG